jgi:hypothetical protein
MRGCNASTLRNHKKYPLLARAMDLVQAERERFRQGDTWEDRHPDD